MSQARNVDWSFAAERWLAAASSNAGFEPEAVGPTHARVDACVVEIQHLFGASAIAVGKSERGEMHCISRNGSQAPALGTELGITSNAAAGLRSGCAILRKFDSSLHAGGTAGARIAVSAPRGEEPSLLVLLFSPDENAFDEIDVDLLHAHADRLELSLREQPDSNPALTGWIAFDALEEPEELATGGEAAAERPTPTSEVIQALAGDALLNGSDHASVDQSAAAQNFILFDDLEAVLPDATSEAEYARAEDLAAVSSAPKQSSDAMFHPAKPSASWLRSFTNSLSPMPRWQAEFAASVLLVVLAASLLLGKGRGASRVSSAAHDLGGRSNAAPTVLADKQPLPAPAAIVTSTHERKTKRHEKPAAQHRSKTAPSADESGAPAEVTPANDIQAYEASIIAAETGDRQAKQQAQALGKKIPLRQIGQVREHIADAFQYSIGAPQDLRKAAMWHSLAAATGNQEARQRLEELRGQMSPAELRAAQADANDWLKRHASSSEVH